VWATLGGGRQTRIFEHKLLAEGNELLVVKLDQVACTCLRHSVRCKQQPFAAQETLPTHMRAQTWQDNTRARTAHRNVAETCLVGRGSNFEHPVDLFVELQVCVESVMLVDDFAEQDLVRVLDAAGGEHHAHEQLVKMAVVEQLARLDAAHNAVCDLERAV
jgi:hypothetical protein